MVPEFVARMRGSNRLSALPTEEPSRFNLWRLGSCAVRRQQVAVGPADRQRRPAIRKEFADSKTSAASIYGGR